MASCWRRVTPKSPPWKHVILAGSIAPAQQFATHCCFLDNCSPDQMDRAQGSLCTRSSMFLTTAFCISHVLPSGWVLPPTHVCNQSCPESTAFTVIAVFKTVKCKLFHMSTRSTASIGLELRHFVFQRERKKNLEVTRKEIHHPDWSSSTQMNREQGKQIGCRAGHMDT